MARHEIHALKRMMDLVLQSTGRSFQGIHLQCRRCREQALARDVETAEGLGGWTTLRKCRGPHYSGLCIDCSRKSPKKGAPHG